MSLASHPLPRSPIGKPLRLMKNSKPSSAGKSAHRGGRSNSRGGGGGRGSTSSRDRDHDRDRTSRWDSPRDRDRDRERERGRDRDRGSPAAKASKAKPSPSLAAAPGGPHDFHDLAGPTHPSLPSQPPAYGFHNLDRRTIVLADGSVRSYFALPPDYPIGPTILPAIDHHHPFIGSGPTPMGHPLFDHQPLPDYWATHPSQYPDHLSSGGPSSVLKRKHDGGDNEDEHARHRRHSSSVGEQLGQPRKQMRDEKHEERTQVLEYVDPNKMQKAFLKFVKMVNENAVLKKKLLDKDGRGGSLQCLVCGRQSKDFADAHGLINHTYHSQNADLHVDHLGLHKALCVFMGWNYATAPDNPRMYRSLSASDAASNREDLIMWPPLVIIHNTSSGKKKDSRIEGMGNREMDAKLKELGFSGGKAKAIYGKDGHSGIMLVNFANTSAGLKDAEELAGYFEKENRGRGGWVQVQVLQSGTDDDKNPALVEVDEKSGEKRRVLYGYLATASDLETVDFDTRKKAVIKSRQQFDPSD